MATKPFETYFSERTLLTGQQSPAGDEQLTLRAGTVFRQNVVYNKALAYGGDAVTVTALATADVWYPLDNVLVQGVTTPTFTYAANQFTYIGPNQIVQTSLKGAVSIQADVLSTIEVGIFVNNLLIANGMSTYLGEANKPLYVASETQRIMATGDVIDLRVRSDTATTSVTVPNIQLVIG